MKFSSSSSNPFATSASPPSEPVTETIRGQEGETGAVAHVTREMTDVGDEAMSQSPPLLPVAGDRIGQYVLQSSLGQGVSCFVFRAWDEENQSPAAIKIVNWANVYDRNAAMRQMRIESAALSRIKHPRVVRFIDYGFDHRWPYIVTEYVEGSSLGALLRSGGALPVEWAVYLLSQMADALGAVWRANLVHRDIKPDNILVGPNGIVKLIDFGLAKAPVLQAASGQSGPELAGTAAYVAPEQAKDASIVDLRADIYSLGVTFYETLTGRLPFEGKNRVQMIFQHINTQPESPIVRVPTIPSIVSDLCLWMLAKNPEERPQNYDELRQSFDTVMGV